jgi:thiamine biosynthesis protein ThiI
MGQWIVRMGEAWLKSKPVRKHFTRILRQTLVVQCRLRGAEVKAHIDGGLMFVSGESDDAICDALKHTFGIHAVDPYIDLPIDPAAVAEAALGELEKIPASFAVQCKRHGHKGEWTSQSFAGATGAAVIEREPIQVNLSNPDWALRVALFSDKARLLGERFHGPGGLPSGVQGLVQAHLETELDVLSAWLIMHRGCRIQAISGSTDALSEWDPMLADPEAGLVTGPGRDKDPMPWGIVGHSLPEAPTTVAEDEEIRIPLANLEPLMGWSESEIDDLRARVFG